MKAVDTAIYESLTFGIRAIYTGIAGALSALLSTYVSPDSFPVFLSIKFLVGSIVGGIVSISGGLVPFSLSSPLISPITYQRRRPTLFSAFIIGLMYLMPNGAIGSVKFILAHVCRITQFHTPKFLKACKILKL
jgi:branched-chain amino acid transport system permease protein